MSALIEGMASIGYIGLLLFLTFYVCGIMGISLFRDNDPWHFGNLELTLMTLVRGELLQRSHHPRRFRHCHTSHHSTHPHGTGLTTATSPPLLPSLSPLVLIHNSQLTRPPKLKLASTFEDWTDLMYINYYGCDKYGYDGMEEWCTKPMAQPLTR